jgi:hypothetical protein
MRCSSETSADFQRITRCYIQEDRTLPNHRCWEPQTYSSYCNFTSLSDFPQCKPPTVGSRDSSVSIKTGYRFGGRGSIPGKDKIFSLLHSVHTCSGVHPACYSMGIGVSFPGVKRPGREADHSPSSAEVKNVGAMPPLPHASSWYTLPSFKPTISTVAY